MEDESKFSESGIGYGKPPRETQFKKGVSGNPKGRPKGSLNVARELERAMNEKVVVNEGGRRTTITKMQAAMKQVANKAASGNLNAIKHVAAWARSLEEQNALEAPTKKDLSETDQKVVENIFVRFDRANKGNSKP